MTRLGAGSNAGTGAEPLPKFLTALAGAELDVDGEMVADALWLAQFVMVEDVAAEVDEGVASAERDGSQGAKMRPEQRREPEPEVEEPEVEVVPQDGGQEEEETAGTGGAAGKVFQAPRAKALRQARALGRALRPLKRRVRSANQQVLDEAATAERTAERRFCLPVMEAAPERWLEVALVVEEAPSMFLWRRTVQEFGQLLERQGAFRDVRTWRLQADEAGEYQLYAQGRGRDLGRPRSARELVDPAGRRLILLVSDCTSGLWRSERIAELLGVWGKEGLFSIVQLLPERLWSRTMLGYGSLARLSGLVPGTANGALRAEPLVWVDEEAGELLKLPVVTLEPGAMGGWAKVLAGFGSSRTGGVLLELDEYLAGVAALPGPKPGASATQPVELTEAEALARVKQFQLEASSRLVCQLAGYMAAVPVSPPITDLIRETLLPGATQAHVAEVYMSGLMRRVRQLEIDAEATDAEPGADEPVRYEFIPAVRRVLVRTILAWQTEQVLEAVSRYLIERHGLAVSSFLALLRWMQEEGVGNVDDEVRAFARFSLETLHQMGPRYGALVDALDIDESDSSDRPQIVEGIPSLSEFEFETAKVSIVDAAKVGTPDSKTERFELSSFEFKTVQLFSNGATKASKRLKAWQFVEELQENLGIELVAIPGKKSYVKKWVRSVKKKLPTTSTSLDVDIQPFFISKYPITQAQWRAVAELDLIRRKLELEPSRFKGIKKPVEQVSWHDAIEFCARLSKKTGRIYRLPTETEWEYACCAGNNTPFYFGETLSTEVANYDGSASYGHGPVGIFRQSTTDVGSFPANSFGLYDMHGNVYEWCAKRDTEKGNEGIQDLYQKPFEPNASSTDDEGNLRVMKGGAWKRRAKICRSISRSMYPSASSSDTSGFRIVCESNQS